MFTLNVIVQALKCFYLFDSSVDDLHNAVVIIRDNQCDIVTALSHAALVDALNLFGAVRSVGALDRLESCVESLLYFGSSVLVVSLYKNDLYGSG